MKLVYKQKLIFNNTVLNSQIYNNLYEYHVL